VDLLSHQGPVLRQIATGIVLLGLLTGAGLFFLPVFPEAARAAVLAASLVSIPLFLSIATVMLMRYADADLLAGHVAAKPVGFAQAWLQNTMEQTLVQALTLIALGLCIPASLLQLLLIQPSCFIVGRTFYLLAYRRDPLRRFTGFALGWYAAIASFLCSGFFLVRTLF